MRYDHRESVVVCVAKDHFWSEKKKGWIEGQEGWRTYVINRVSILRDYAQWWVVSPVVRLKYSVFRLFVFIRNIHAIWLT